MLQCAPLCVRPGRVSLVVVAKGGKGGGGGGAKGGGGKGGGGGGGKHTPMTQTDASRIQSAEARANDGIVEKGSFASRAQASLSFVIFQLDSSIVAAAES
ncbi:hypothetical protein D9Q98_005727 [Chlorella vulgaris]|uniref:SMP domain-containing protein n=1 Tax=Chlorella vulgaris TaxID=3077 RepID=A0A9D4TME4_CHLVU|nr:hypothetical protein D9Q98_005727 [Chlorella vulgaris]